MKILLNTIIVILIISMILTICDIIVMKGF
jgi:hypothetical protein